MERKSLFRCFLNGRQARAFAYRKPTWPGEQPWHALVFSDGDMLMEYRFPGSEMPDISSASVWIGTAEKDLADMRRSYERHAESEARA